MTYAEQQAMTKEVNSSPQIEAIEEDLKEAEAKHEAMYEEIEKWTAKDVQKEQNLFSYMSVLQDKLDELKTV